MATMRERAARPVRHELAWPSLAALIALVLVIGIGVTTMAALPTAASAGELAFALAPSLAWTVASLLIGRFLAAGLIRQGAVLSLASALLMAGALVIVGAFCVMPYEFLLTDRAGLSFDVVLPLWGLGVLLLLAAAAMHVAARRYEGSRPNDDAGCGEPV